MADGRTLTISVDDRPRVVIPITDDLFRDPGLARARLHEAIDHVLTGLAYERAAGDHDAASVAMKRRRRLA